MRTRKTPKARTTFLPLVEGGAYGLLGLDQQDNAGDAASLADSPRGGGEGDSSGSDTSSTADCSEEHAGEARDDVWEHGGGEEGAEDFGGHEHGEQGSGRDAAACGEGEGEGGCRLGHDEAERASNTSLSESETAHGPSESETPHALLETESAPSAPKERDSPRGGGGGLRLGSEGESDGKGDEEAVRGHTRSPEHEASHRRGDGSTETGLAQAATGDAKVRLDIGRQASLLPSVPRKARGADSAQEDGSGEAFPLRIPDVPRKRALSDDDTDAVLIIGEEKHRPKHRSGRVAPQEVRVDRDSASDRKRDRKAGSAGALSDDDEDAVLIVDQVKKRPKYKDRVASQEECVDRERKFDRKAVRKMGSAGALSGDNKDAVLIVDQEKKGPRQNSDRAPKEVGVDSESASDRKADRKEGGAGDEAKERGTPAATPKRDGHTDFFVAGQHKGSGTNGSGPLQGWSSLSMSTLMAICPADWAPKISRSKQEVFWYHRDTREATWVPPPGCLSLEEARAQDKLMHKEPSPSSQRLETPPGKHLSEVKTPIRAQASLKVQALQTPPSKHLSDPCRGGASPGAGSVLFPQKSTSPSLEGQRTSNSESSAGKGSVLPLQKSAPPSLEGRRTSNSESGAGKGSVLPLQKSAPPSLEGRRTSNSESSAGKGSVLPLQKSAPPPLEGRRTSNSESSAGDAADEGMCSDGGLSSDGDDDDSVGRKEGSDDGRSLKEDEWDRSKRKASEPRSADHDCKRAASCKEGTGDESVMEDKGKGRDDWHKDSRNERSKSKGWEERGRDRDDRHDDRRSDERSRSRGQKGMGRDRENRRENSRPERRSESRERGERGRDRENRRESSRPERRSESRGRGERGQDRDHRRESSRPEGRSQSREWGDRGRDSDHRKRSSRPESRSQSRGRGEKSRDRDHRHESNRAERRSQSRERGARGRDRGRMKGSSRPERRSQSRGRGERERDRGGHRRESSRAERRSRSRGREERGRKDNRHKSRDGKRSRSRSRGGGGGGRNRDRGHERSKRDGRSKSKSRGRRKQDRDRDRDRDRRGEPSGRRDQRGERGRHRDNAMDGHTPERRMGPDSRGQEGRGWKGESDINLRMPASDRQQPESLNTGARVGTACTKTDVRSGDSPLLDAVGGRADSPGVSEACAAEEMDEGGCEDIDDQLEEFLNKNQIPTPSHGDQRPVSTRMDSRGNSAGTVLKMESRGNGSRCRNSSLGECYKTDVDSPEDLAMGKDVGELQGVDDDFCAKDAEEIRKGGVQPPKARIIAARGVRSEIGEPWPAAFGSSDVHHSHRGRTFGRYLSNSELASVAFVPEVVLEFVPSPRNQLRVKRTRVEDRSVIGTKGGELRGNLHEGEEGSKKTQSHDAMIFEDARRQEAGRGQASWLSSLGHKSFDSGLSAVLKQTLPQCDREVKSKVCALSESVKLDLRWMAFEGSRELTTEATRKASRAKSGGLESSSRDLADCEPRDSVGDGEIEDPSALSGMLATQRQYLRRYQPPGVGICPFARYSTKVEALDHVAYVLARFLRPLDVLIDFRCGENELGPILHKNFGITWKAFDVATPKSNVMNFAQKLWLEVEPLQLRGDLVIGLRPPEDLREAMRFLRHSVKFRPRLLVVLLPQAFVTPEGYRIVHCDDSTFTVENSLHLCHASCLSAAPCYPGDAWLKLTIFERIDANVRH